MKTRLCVCGFCGHIIDSRMAMLLARIGGIPMCDEICTEAYNAMLDDRVNAEVVLPE